MKDKKGSALLFTTAILMILATSGVSFVQLMKLERHSAKNYTDREAARLAALAGIERAICGLQDLLIDKPYTEQGDWTYQAGEGQPLFKAIDGADAISFSIGQAYNRQFSGAVGVPNGSNVIGTYENTGNTYALKILESAAQINLNSHIASTPAQQTVSTAMLARIVNNLAKACGGDAQTHAADLANWLVTSRAINPVLKVRWVSKDAVIEELRQRLPGADLSKFIDCITVNSWIDHTTCQPLSPVNPAVTHIPRYSSECRAPVNINTAPREVLIAVLEGLCASPILWHTTVNRQNDNDGNVGGGGGNVFDDYTMDYTPTRLTSNEFMIDHATAENLADAIITARSVEPFRHWDDFSRFVDTLSCADNAGWFDNMNPGEGSTAPDPDLGKNVWRQAYRDMLRANFNPNAIDNCFNPNKASFMRTTKADLFDNSLNYCYSTEFCFSSMGRYEIISLGRITASSGQEFARVQLRADVQLADILRHTSQEDFESAVAGSLPVRQNVWTFPQLTSLGWTPDKYVGRIEPGLISGLPTPGGVSRTYPSGATHPFLNAATRAIPLSNSQRFTEMKNSFGWSDARSMDSSGITSLRTDGRTHLVPDGLLSSRFQANLGSTRYFSTAMFGGSLPAGSSWRGTNLHANARMPYYRGSMQFWVKLTEDSNAQIGCGLFSASLVNPDPQYYWDPTYGVQDPYGVGEAAVKASWPYTEGVQFYVFKNTLGELRFSRIYFCLCFRHSDNHLVGSFLTTDADDFNLGGTRDPQDYTHTGHTHIRFAYPRKDIVVRASDLGWEAHTWHHVAVSWDDSDGDPTTNLIKVWIDGNQVATAVQVVCDSTREERNGSWDPCNSATLRHPEHNYTGCPEYCQLNEYNPRNCLNICGFFRPQREAKGIFKFDNEVNFPANATISGLEIYDNTASFNNAPSRFLTNTSYTHRFQVPHNGRLAWILVTLYPTPPAPGDPLYATIDASLDGSTWNWSSVDLPATKLDGKNVKANDEVMYRIRFADTPPDPQMRGAVDDVTLLVLHTRIVRISELDV